MGCDIHLHIEIKVGGEWHHYNHPYIRRNYALFARMAGVRNSDNAITPIASPRGLPDHPSIATIIDLNRWGTDAHSVSWLCSEEIIDLESWVATIPGSTQHGYDYWGFLFGNPYSGFMKYPNDYPYEIEDFRFVFWFDN